MWLVTGRMNGILFLEGARFFFTAMFRPALVPT